MVLSSSEKNKTKTKKLEQTKDIHAYTTLQSLIITLHKIITISFQKYDFWACFFVCKNRDKFQKCSWSKKKQKHLWIPVIKCNKNPYGCTRWLVMTLFQTDRCVQALYGPLVTFQGFPSDRRHLAVTNITLHGPSG